MKIIKEIIYNDFDFILYETDRCYVLNVLFTNSFVEFYRSFKLSEDEAKLDLEKLKHLSEKIRMNYDTFKDREISPVLSSIKP